MSTIDVGMRLGDAIDPFQLANGFEAVIGYECQERSNHPFSHSYDAYMQGVTKQVSGWGGVPVRNSFASYGASAVVDSAGEVSW